MPAIITKPVHLLAWPSFYSEPVQRVLLLRKDEPTRLAAALGGRFVKDVGKEALLAWPIIAFEIVAEFSDQSSRYDRIRFRYPVQGESTKEPLEMDFESTLVLDSAFAKASHVDKRFIYLLHGALEDVLEDQPFSWLIAHLSGRFPDWKSVEEFVRRDRRGRNISAETLRKRAEKLRRQYERVNQDWEPNLRARKKWSRACASDLIAMYEFGFPDQHCHRLRR